MSRVAKQPIEVPSNVEINLNGNDLKVKGAKGELSLTLHDTVGLETAEVDGKNVINIVVKAESKQAVAMSGTTRALVNNMVHGVSQGFERGLELVGVGYRAQAKGNVLSLSLGYSHTIDYELPQDVTAETPSQTQIVLKSINKQKLGQAAAEIKAFRPPEPYKGKGVRYAGEHILRKEAKKK